MNNALQFLRLCGKSPQWLQGFAGGMTALLLMGGNLCWPTRAEVRHSLPHAGAIVQLQGLDVPQPRVKGAATLSLQRLEQTQVFTTVGMLSYLPSRFLIDTGASTSMLSQETVETLKLAGTTIPSDRLSSAVAGNECASMNATLHALPTLKMDAVEIRGASALRFEKTAIPEGLSGVMGMDILNHFDLQFNPAAQTLQLSAPTALPASMVASAIPLRQKLGVFLATVTINSQGPFTMLLDTGADGTFISQPLASRLNLDARARHPIQILGFCGLEPAERTQISSLKLQQQEQRNLEVVILSSPILKLLGVDGILGQNFLSKYYQYWRFTPYSSGGISQDGSLLLWPQNANKTLNR
ncbi:MAG TPA: retropepsin-like aspartic protease [Stenomitos sp.]